MATKDSRTKDRHKRTRKLVEAKRNAEQKPSDGTQYTWSLNESETEEVFKDLDVAELRWPDEGVRDSSQEIDKAASNGFIQKLAANSFTRGRKTKPSRTCGVCPNRNASAHLIDKNATERHDPFAHLSDEIILGIFKFLSQQTLSVCAQVCKDWQILAYDESLWKSVDMSKTKLSPGVLGSVLLRGTKILRVASSKVFSPIFDESFSSFPDVVPVSQESSDSVFKLTHLDATLCLFEDSSLLCLLMHSRRLKCLSLDSCCLSLSILRAIGVCEELEVLNLTMCTGITLQGLKALVNGCKRLRELNLAWTHLSKESILQVIHNLPNLTHLNLSGCRQWLTDEVVLQLVDHCHNLTHLDLSDGVEITAESLIAISKKLSLQHLSISRCYSIQPHAFRVCAEMKSLAKLDIFGLLNADGVLLLRTDLPGIDLNTSLFSIIARPVSTKYNGAIWGMKCEK